jgi:hypothetical protein
VIAIAALRLPIAAGVNVTLIVQVAAAATETPQLFVWLKSPVLPPVTAMLVTASAAFPVFVSVTD